MVEGLRKLIEEMSSIFAFQFLQALHLLISAIRYEACLAMSTDRPTEAINATLAEH